MILCLCQCGRNRTATENKQMFSLLTHFHIHDPMTTLLLSLFAIFTAGDASSSISPWCTNSSITESNTTLPLLRNRAGQRPSLRTALTDESSPRHSRTRDRLWSALKQANRSRSADAHKYGKRRSYGFHSSPPRLGPTPPRGRNSAPDVSFRYISSSCHVYLK